MFHQLINSELLVTNTLCSKSVAINVSMNDNNKRLSDQWMSDDNEWSEMSSSKRLCNNDHNYANICTDSNESQELYRISCLMNNFRLNYTECPEWPTDWLNECCVQTNQMKSVSNTDENNGIFPPMIGEIYFGFKLENCLKRDKRCAVFEACHNTNDGQRFVVKIGIAKGSKILKYEYDNYKKIANTGITSLVPKLFDTFYSWSVVKNGISNEWSMLVMEKLGADLAQLMHISPNCNHLPYELVSSYAIQMITCLEMIHSRGLLHRKVKPQHFVISSREEDNSGDCKPAKICLISFGAAKSYLNETLAHIDYQKDKKLPKGDPLFYSIYHFDGIRRTRRDDMESLGYCLVYLIKGSLPWSNNGKTLSSNKYIRAVANKMRQTSLEVLCDNIPQSFYNYFTAISNLNFEDKPDYDLLRRCFDISVDNQF